MEQGDIYIADFDEAGMRPAVVVSRDELNRGHSILMVPFTSQNLDVRRNLPTCVLFRRGEFGLNKDCVAQCDAAARLNKRWIELPKVGKLDALTLRSVINAIGDVIAAECEPV
ncbi:MAG: type II toxin-antitoxin system PemK/MazF family toxin [Planctomycetota bacterium]